MPIVHFFFTDRVDLSFNKLTGPIPSEIGELTRMSTFLDWDREEVLSIAVLDHC